MRIWNYVFIITGMAILLQLAGFNIGFEGLFNAIGLEIQNGVVEEASNSDAGFWNAIFSTDGILAAVGTGVVIGTLTRASPENYIILPFITSNLVLYASIMYNIINYAVNYDSPLAILLVLIFAPLGVGFMIASMEFFRGTD